MFYKVMISTEQMILIIKTLNILGRHIGTCLELMARPKL